MMNNEVISIELRSINAPPVLVERISGSPNSGRSLLDPHHNSTSHLDKKIRDEWLRNLGSSEQYSIWSPEDLTEAQKLPKGFKKITDRQEKIAFISGGLAGGAGVVGMIPTWGPLLGAPFSFIANYYGAYEGAELGFDYARLCDLRQDVYKDSEKLYTALAIRLLDKYIKTLRAERADALERENLGKVRLMEDERKQKLLRKKAEIQALSAKILANLPELEKQATEAIWGHKLRRRTPEEIARDAEKQKEPTSLAGRAVKYLTTTEYDRQKVKRQQQIFKIKREIESATLPLKEVCKYIAGEQTDFSVVILHNELDTMTIKCERELEKTLRTGLDARRDQEYGELRSTVNDLMEANRALLAQLQEMKESKRKHHSEKAKKAVPQALPPIAASVAASTQLQTADNAVAQALPQTRETATAQPRM